MCLLFSRFLRLPRSRVIVSQSVVVGSSSEQVTTVKWPLTMGLGVLVVIVVLTFYFEIIGDLKVFQKMAWEVHIILLTQLPLMLTSTLSKPGD